MRDVVRTEGVIRPDELYTLPELKRRLAVKNTAWRTLRDKGLKPIPHGRNYYFLGSSVIEVFRRMAEELECVPESK